jgi:hypothetical protein
MSKKLISILFIISLTISFISCNSNKISILNNEKQNQEGSTNESLLKSKELEKIANEKDSEINMLKSEMDKRGINFDDQRKVEKLIKDYFIAIERKDYASAWELTSPELKNTYPREMAIKEHWGIESLKFISMQGYLPPKISKTGEVPPNIPTVWFGVTFEIEPSPNSTWSPWKGRTARYVEVVKDTDGKWTINGLNTGFWVIN